MTVIAIHLLPSPNLPRLEGCLAYPGQVLLEGTNLSEGRGTTTPFEVFGAPFVRPPKLLAELKPFQLAGVWLRPIRFQPTFDKWQGKSCGGLYLHVTDPQAFRPLRTTLALLTTVRRLWPKEFAWRDPPYEYEKVKKPIDIVFGSCTLREALDRDAFQKSVDLDELARLDSVGWRKQVADYLLYE